MAENQLGAEQRAGEPHGEDHEDHDHDHVDEQFEGTTFHGDHSPTRPLVVAYVGNFRPEHSTENHVRQALERNGHTVDQWQENEQGTWERLPGQVAHYDLILWTRTGWDPPVPHDVQFAMLNEAEKWGTPTVGFHLDRWWGLDREGQVKSEPFFRSALVVTADGGHDDEWKAAGVEHHWMPPGVSLGECERVGKYRRDYDFDVAFVGSWRSYHAEWAYRFELVQWLRRTYRRRFGLFPRGRGIRGQDLADLYASAKVIVGDSCLAGGVSHYWSDRIPETVGRGGYLLHPHVLGLAEHFTPGEHLDTYTLGDWDQLRKNIEWALGAEQQRDQIAEAGQQHVMVHHTYERRMEQLVDVLTARSLL